MRVGRNSRNSGRASSHCCISISMRAVEGRSPNWLCCPSVRIRCTSFSAFSTGNASALIVVSSSCLKNVVHRRSRLWNASRNFERVSAGLIALHGAAVEPQAVVVVVLVVAPDDAQAVLLVLDVAPQQVVERAQRIDLEVGERILRRRRRARSGSAG